MTDRNKRITEELIMLQTAGYGSKMLANHIFPSENNDLKFREFQGRLFEIVDKVNNGILSFTKQEIAFIGSVKMLIIAKYKHEAEMSKLIREDDILSEMYDRKIVEVEDLFSDFKQLEE